MGIRTGKELLESLRDDRALFIDGERVADVTTDPRFAGAARSLADLYDMQHDPALAPRMTFASPVDGAPVGLSFIEPRSVADLVRRREMIKLWMDATCGMLGRSPDFMNVFLTGLASAADTLGDKDAHFADNLRAYHAFVRDNDLCLTHTLEARRAAGQGPGCENREGNERGDRDPRRAHGLDLGGLCE